MKTASAVIVILLVILVVVVALVRDKNIKIEAPGVTVETTDPETREDDPETKKKSDIDDRVRQAAAAINRLSEGTIKVHRIANPTNKPGQLAILGKSNEFKLEYEYFKDGSTNASFFVGFAGKVTTNKIAEAYIRRKPIMDLCDWKAQ